MTKDFSILPFDKYEEFIEIINEFTQGYNGNFEEKRKHYWQEVREEINKL